MKKYCIHYSNREYRPHLLSRSHKCANISFDSNRSHLFLFLVVVNNFVFYCGVTEIAVEADVAMMAIVTFVVGVGVGVGVVEGVGGIETRGGLCVGAGLGGG